ncbi:MAG: MarR family transcriptional regulator [Erysipelotrichaceae bacterium]|nr:MarR family transcriptional regulator [Erysipelotrichaceae bacterium]MDY5252116.1 helix-turn-helix domain-containing protein [Erysipelotrichaceae bacterium]
MQLLNEELLNTWINLITTINSDRLTPHMPLNESIILRILYHANGQQITATKLCQELGIQKSQMNRILQNMEDKQLISRERSKDDKRVIIIHLNSSQLTIFQAQHQEILAFIDKIIAKVGDDKIKQTITLLNEIIVASKGE